MRQAYGVLPVYAGDVSGVASALFELGGMTVIDDPSGCNSTYNTHDETRWYDQDSLIFISGLRDVDAIMGDDEKLVRDVVAAVRETHPAFVTLVCSPIPYQVGRDFAAIAREVQAQTGVPTYQVATNGMHDYVRGAGLAFQMLAEHQVREPDAADCTKLHGAAGRRVNVLGMTPLDFAGTDPDSVRTWLRMLGFSVVSCWAMGDGLESVRAAACADANLVVSATGLRAARALRQRFGTPYVVGVPMEGFSAGLQRALARSCEDGVCRLAYQDTRAEALGTEAADAASAEVALVGEPVQMGSVAAALAVAGVRARVVSPLEETDALVNDRLGDTCVRGEEGIVRAIAGASTVVGDPFLQFVCAGQRFVRLPHFAYSGRQWLREVPDLVRLRPAELLREGGQR
jgi:hypothetical protein